MIGAHTAPSFTVPDWTERNAQKLCSADEALRVERGGQLIFVGSSAAQPQLLVERLTARAEQLRAADSRGSSGRVWKMDQEANLAQRFVGVGRSRSRRRPE